MATVVIIRCVAIGVCERARGTGGLYISCVRAVSCHRAGGSHLQCCHRGVRRGASSPRGHFLPAVRCRAGSACRVWLPAVLPPGCATRRPAAPAGPNISGERGSFGIPYRMCTRTARQSARVKWGPVVPADITLSRARRCRAIVLGVVTHGAALSMGKRASSTRRILIAYVRCGAIPSCRRCSPTVLPSECATSASGTSRPDIS